MTVQPAPTRTSSFGYICRRCSRCCQHKHIQLDPYELARLAHAKGETTTSFRMNWTVGGQGTALAQKEDGTCVFLGPEGCEVHADRPLVCRLYPLGRHFRSDGQEYFSMSEGHPLSAGEYHSNGSIADYLRAQNTEAFISAGDAYFKWFYSAYKKLGVSDELLISEAIDGGDDAGLLDMDAMITRHCAATGEPEPRDIEDRLQLHLRLLYDVLATVEIEDDEENSIAESGAPR